MRTPNILGICAALSTGLFAQVAVPPAERPAERSVERPNPHRPQRPERLRGQMQARVYDKSREETMKAKVVDVREIDRGPTVVVVLAVQVEGQDAEIPLGSKDYLKENGMVFSKGDEITIKGIRNSRQPRTGPGGAEGSSVRDIMDIRDLAGAPDGPKPKEGGKAAPGKPGSEGIMLRKEGPLESGKPGKEGPAAQKDSPKDPKGPDSPSNGAPRIRAREVTKGGKTLTILNDDGRPAWRPGPPTAAGGQAMPESPGKPGKSEK
jgi:hypothetical protein